MQPIKNFHNPERVKTYLPLGYPEDSPVRGGTKASPGYEGIKKIDASKGITYWQDGRVTQWSTDTERPEIEEGEDTPFWVKWRARVNAYWSTYPYRCQACGAGGQRPNNVNEGPVTLHRFDGLPGFGDERDDDLAALCTPCLDETRQVAEGTGEDWEFVVARWTSRHRRGEARRRRTISVQAARRRHKRTRTQEWRDEIQRRTEAGITLNDPDFFDEYRDVYDR